MNLVNIELGKWIYLIIYLIIPVIMIVYLIRTFGLKTQEDPPTTARQHIEQADYWANIALRTAQSHAGTKSLSSLSHTINNNLNLAFTALINADPNTDVATIKIAYYQVEEKLILIQGLASNPPTICLYQPHLN